MRTWKLSLLLLLVSTFPAQGGQEVRTGVYATELYNIDFQHEEFELQFWIWFLHSDQNYRPWLRSEVINAKSFKVLASNREKVAGKYFDSVKYHALVRMDWNLALYPFDRQTLVVKLEDNQETADALQFVIDRSQSGLNHKALPHGWHLEGVDIRSQDNLYPSTFGDPRRAEHQKPSFSQIQVFYTIKRQGSRLFVTLFLGFFVAWLLSTLVFTANCFRRILDALSMQELTAISIGALFTAMANIYTLSDNLPYTTDIVLADHMQIISMTNVVLAIFMTIWTRIWLSGKGADLVYGQAPLFLVNRFLVSIWLIFCGGYMGHFYA